MLQLKSGCDELNMREKYFYAYPELFHKLLHCNTLAKASTTNGEKKTVAI
jgi:hypothetical protein